MYGELDERTVCYLEKRKAFQVGHLAQGLFTPLPKTTANFCLIRGPVRHRHRPELLRTHLLRDQAPEVRISLLPYRTQLASFKDCRGTGAAAVPSLLEQLL